MGGVFVHVCGFIFPFLQLVKLKFLDLNAICRQAFFHYNFIHDL